ncbi:MAG: YdcF family protein [Eubacteriales bacterium]|nr:YdcF family protein [Eubacteriales bacterium]MDD3883211.1 YdcF family protein [Eubacteriales bacterium]MDD4512713.1 YdcF family protein [Eubacteriales bacterium]
MQVILTLLIIGIIVYMLCIAAIYIAKSNIKPAENGDVMIILGCQVKPDGELSVQLEYRLKTALEQYNKKPVPIICCGAQGSNEPMTEAEAMYNYLTANGIAPEQLFKEDKSFSTYENLLYAKEIMQENGFASPIIVTSDYHLPRALAIAEKAGLHASGVGAPIKPEYFIKNYCREVLGWVKFILGLN